MNFMQEESKASIGIDEINNLLRKNKRGDAEKMGKVYEKLLHCDN